MIPAGESGGDYAARNRAAWDGFADWYREPGRRNWRENVIRWGIWGVPEEQLHVLPDVTGMDVIELGCGTGYVSSWLARRGAKPVGIDNSPNQLESARGFQQEFGVEFPLILGNGEQAPLEDQSFDFAISEYGAAIWCDPYKWIPEASRLLRPGGKLVFMGNSPLFMLFAPDEEGVAAGTCLLRDYFGMHRFEWPDDDSVEFHLGHGDWIRLLRKSGFEIEDLVEVRPPENATTRYPHVTPEWARRWPAEEFWIAHKR
jgi:SAM-dependent methyltransferase